MDWNAAIEKNREALKRILAALVAMAGLAGGGSTLPRHLHRAVLRLLRPAESAVRRLVIVAARGLVVTLPPQRPRWRRAKPKSMILRNGVGTGIVMPVGVPLPPPLTPPPCGEGLGVGVRAPPSALSRCRCSIGFRVGKPVRAARSPPVCRASRCPASPRGFPSCPAACQRPAIRSTLPVSASALPHSPQPSTTCRDRQNASPAGKPAATRSSHKPKTQTPPRKAAVSRIAAGRIETGR